MNTFMNFMNRSLARRGTKDGVGVLKEVGASLLVILDLSRVLASSSCSMELTKKLMQGLCQVMRDPRAIVKDEEKDQGHDSSKSAGWPIGYGAFRIVKWSTYGITLDWTRWGDAQHKRKKITCRIHVTWLRKKCTKPGKMCNQHFLLNWVWIIEPVRSDGRTWRIMCYMGKM